MQTIKKTLWFDHSIALSDCLLSWNTVQFFFNAMVLSHSEHTPLSWASVSYSRTPTDNRHKLSVTRSNPVNCQEAWDRRKCYDSVQFPIGQLFLKGCSVNFFSLAWLISSDDSRKTMVTGLTGANVFNFFFKSNKKIWLSFKESYF
jgi:hypothetical protein